MAISHTNGFMCQLYNLDNLGGYIVTSIILWEIYDVFRWLKKVQVETS